MSFPVAAQIAADRKNPNRVTESNVRKASESASTLVDLPALHRAAKGTFVEQTLRRKHAVAKTGPPAERRQAAIEISLIEAFRDDKLPPHFATNTGTVFCHQNGRFWRVEQGKHIEVKGISVDFGTPAFERDPDSVEAAAKAEFQAKIEHARNHPRSVATPDQAVTLSGKPMANRQHTVA